MVIASLLGGLALPAIIRAVKLPQPSFAQELTERQQLMAEARNAGIDLLNAQDVTDDQQRVADLLRADAGFLGETLDTYGPDASIPHLEAKYRLRRKMLDAERAAVLQARTEGRFQEPAIVAALQAIDAEEVALRYQFPKET